MKEDNHIMRDHMTKATCWCEPRRQIIDGQVYWIHPSLSGDPTEKEIADAIARDKERDDEDSIF